ncbi:MAG: NAD(P)-dependent oxidoreductase [Rubrivivax sp.]
MILVTGSAGHLGEALMLTLRERGTPVRGIDVLPSSFTDAVGSIVDRAFVRDAMRGVTQVLHAATLHKPHVATHTRQQFVDTNVTGTLHLLEEAAAAKVRAFVCTSTTSAFGRALVPPPGEPAAWITEAVRPVPKNIYGVTKVAAEDLCELMHGLAKMPVLVLRTSRFFPENDDDPEALAERSAANLQANEFLSRRVDIEDVVSAHLDALEAAPRLGFGRFIVSATTPFAPEDLPELRRDAPAVLARRVPGWQDVYARHGWTMNRTLDRVYVNALAREQLGWRPRTDFAAVVRRLAETGDIRSALARRIGQKGYHR